MAINRIEIKDFLVFKGEFAIDFCPGINVIIGGNATGKTTLLRMMYGKSNWFQNGVKNAKFNIYAYGEFFSELKAIEKSGELVYTSTREFPNNIYIPEFNILSHSRGLPETVKYGKLSFNFCEIEIVEKARVLPSVPKQPLVEKIEKIIGGEVYLAEDGQTFLVKKNDLGFEIPLLFEASGYQKFALLAALIRNEQIKSGSILFWDEPENSLNPEMIPYLVFCQKQIA